MEQNSPISLCPHFVKPHPFEEFLEERGTRHNLIPIATTL